MDTGPLLPETSEISNFEVENIESLDVCAINPLLGPIEPSEYGVIGNDLPHRCAAIGERKPPMQQEKTIIRVQNKLQIPPEGPFDRDDLQWEKKRLMGRVSK